jgi:predicted NAD/FAD-dependent oxidoreductase
MSANTPTAPTDDGQHLPQPASQPLTRELAERYTQLTDGQLTALHHPNGHWYLHTPGSARRAA